MTPLYKSLKSNGTSFYAFPGAAEESTSMQNTNLKVYFSKYILLNLPKQNLTSGTNSNPIYFDFDNSFERSPYGIGGSITYKDQLVESLRNYVANYEVTMKESKLNNTEYYYDNTVLNTPSEKIFWKWCKKLNLIDFEPANPGDQYFDNLIEFQSNNLTDDKYFPEVLWQERQVIKWNTYRFFDYGGALAIEFKSTTNFRIGDTIEFTNLENLLLTSFNGKRVKVTSIVPPTSTVGQIIVTDDTTIVSAIETVGTANLVYHKLVQYIGEVNGVNNVQETSRSYKEVHIYIPAHNGQTPDILFRTMTNDNYKPNMSFPILPSQYQPEIIGAENFTNPIVNTPEDYPGNYYAQFDTNDFTYETQTGDLLRRSGDYFGIVGDINTPTVNGNTIDGISVDFNPAHYVKMNIFGQEIGTFDEFNSLMVNNEPPKDFEFNAVLWYYTIEDNLGNTSENLYGISILDNPDNNPTESEVGLRIPTFRKLATTNTQDGISYSFSLNLNYYINNDNPQDLYNPSNINSLFSFGLYNDAMAQLSQTNQSFLEIISNQVTLATELSNLKQLLYTQQDFLTINKKIGYLETLLKLYSTNQIISSDTISVTTNTYLNNNSITLNNIDPNYNIIYDVLSSNLYNSTGIIPYTIAVPTNKTFLISIVNDDTISYSLPNNDNLTIVIDSDLDYKQSVDIFIDSTNIATQNKKLDIYIKFLYSTSISPVETLLIGDIDLPIYFNENTQTQNSAWNWTNFNFNIDLNKYLILNTGGILEVPISSNYNLVNNSFKTGDTLILENFHVGTQSQMDFSGQYKIQNVGATNSYVHLDISTNQTLVNYGASASLPLKFNAGTWLLSNTPNFRLNKGLKIKITRIDQTNTSSISERYLIEKSYL